MINKGITLLEVLFTLLIVSVLATISWPSFSHWWQMIELNSAERQFSALLQRGRFTAVNQQHQVIICPQAKTSTDCGSDWQRPLMLFIDTNTDQHHQQNEPIIATLAAITHIHIVAKGQPLVVYQPLGSVTMARRLLFCIPYQQRGKALSISKQGRLAHQSLRAGDCFNQ